MVSCFTHKTLDRLGVRWFTTFANAAIFVGMATGISLLPVGALAQDAVIEEILVTGSRIPRGNLTQPNPVYGLDSDDIKFSGELNLVDLLDDLPQLFSSSTGAQSDFFTQDGINNTPGLTQLNLRGLGSNRTLVLVDGKRHVSGQAGTAAVDITSIPSALVERVEVLTGGASSIYGADAVSGVVNFIMKKTFVGTELDLVAGWSDEGAGEEVQFSFTHGRNFFNDRLNITVNLTARRREDVMNKDRRWAKNTGIANVQSANWRRVFQRSDMLPAGVIVGDAITTEDAAGNCIAVIAGTDPSIVSRACNAAPAAVEGNQRFGLTAPGGLFAISLAGRDFGSDLFPFPFLPGTRADDFPFFFTSADIANSGLAPGTPVMDFNNNGIDDCEESVMGTADRAVGGCVVIDPDGTIRPFNPGLVDGTFLNFDAIGGDGSPHSGADDQTLDPLVEQFTINTRINFELTDTANLFADIKYTEAETFTRGGTISFHDTINISIDNPFVPMGLQTLMNDILALNPQFADTAQYFMSRDPEDIHASGEYDRKTFRVVAGIEGEFWDSWTYEFAFNYGKTEEEARDQALLLDRWYAALDAVDDGSGNAVCRSEVDPAWTIDSFNNGSIWGVPGVNTFTPGDGTCVAANAFGHGRISEAAQDFIAPWRKIDDEIEQTVLSLIVTGDTERWFTLPAGAIGLAGGLEYRKEESESTPNAFEIAGYYHPFGAGTEPIKGDFNVKEVFIEFSVPVLADVTMAEELTIDGAYRYSDYDLDVDTTNTWSVGFSWAPVRDIRFRGTKSRAIRAPNIFELFSPLAPATFNQDIEPCDQIAFDLITDPTKLANRMANCAADPLVGPGFVNPLTSFFVGQSGGNPALFEETSDTTTIGLVFTPRFLEGLTVTVDWWEIEIEDAVQTIEASDVVNACYDGPSLDPTFCNKFTRVSDPTSGFFGGLNFLTTGQINLASLETSGIDFEAVYTTDLFGGVATFRLNGTWLDELEEFRSATNPTLGDIETGEMLRPIYAGNFNARWSRDRLTLDYQARYMGNQTHNLVEEDAVSRHDNATTGILWIHDISASYEVSEMFTVYGGVQNFTDEQPFDTQVSFPTGIRGRYGFLGVTAHL